jgi:hypothetical protein
MLSKNLFLCYLLVLVVCNCGNNHPSLSGDYSGFWYDTSFDFTFRPNGEFEMETGGHFGQTLTTGKYSMIDTTVFLLPDSDNVLQNNFGISFYKLIYHPSNGCLTGFDNHVYCPTEERTWKLAEKRHARMDRDQEFLLNLLEVKNYVLTQTDTVVDFLSRPRIEFERIRTLKQKHYKEYRLMVNNSERKTTDLYMKFLVPARIKPYLVEVGGTSIFREGSSVADPLIFVAEIE